MRSGRKFVALFAGCRVCPLRQQLTRSFFTVAANETLTGARKDITRAAVINTATRHLHLSSVIYTAAETSLGIYTNANSDNNNNNNNNNSASGGETALDVAMRVNKLKRLHQTGGGPDGKKRIELDAWNELNGLTEEQINVAEGKEVSLLLNSWAYFAKYWEKGRDGPMGVAVNSSAETQSPSTSEGTPQQNKSDFA